MNRLKTIYLQINFFLLFLLLVTAETSNESGSFTNRLPSSILPIHYDLFLRVQLGDASFDGNVTVSINVTKPTSTIILHSKNLNISSTDLLSAESKTPVPLLKTYEIEEYEYWVLELYEAIEVGLYEIRLEFSAFISNSSHGFYQVSYSEADSETEKLVLAAELEPSAARTVFPCFDEPHLKATFKITIQHTHDDGYYALSNMDIESVARYDDFSVTTFKESVKMSTYLLTFVITNFEGQSVMIDTKGIGEPFKLTIYGQQKWENATKFSLEIAKAAVEFLIEYFDEPFHISKLDIIGIPRLGPTATESWGLIVFHENALFADNGDESRAVVAYSIAHELAHQWLGNLVTMKWWDNIWLNEGFATFMGLKVISNLQPELDIDKHVWRSYIQKTLKFDSTSDTHPIIQVVSDTKNKGRIFDSLSYIKAGSVITMLENYIGDEKLRLAIRRYIKEYAFGNVEAFDLIDVVQNICPDKDVRTYLKAWTDQPSYPLINIEKAGNDSYKLTQTCYTSSVYLDDFEQARYRYEYDILEISANSWNFRAEKDDANEKCSGSWPVPITYITDQGAAKEAFLLDGDRTEEFLVLPNAKWIKLNPRWSGFYRVNYSREMWLELSDVLSQNNSVLKNIDHLQLVDDVFDMMHSNHLDFDVLLEFLKFLESENDTSIWYDAYQFFEDVYKTLNAEERESFKRFFRDIVDSYVENYPAMVFNYNSAVDLGSVVENKQCVQAAKKLLDSCIEQQNYEELEQLAELAQLAVTKTLPPETWLALWDSCKSTWEYPICSALAGTDHLPLLLKLLYEVVRLENVEDEVVFSTYKLASLNNFTFVWDYLHNNFVDLRDARPAFELSQVIDIAKLFLVEDGHMAQLKALLDKYPTDNKDQEESRKAHLQEAEENFKINKKWRTLTRRFLANQSG